MEHKLNYRPFDIMTEWSVIIWVGRWELEAAFFGPYAQENAYEYLRVALQRDRDGY